MLPSLELKKNSPVSQSKLYNSVKSTVHLQVNFIFLITFHLFYFSSSFSPHAVSFQKKERKCVKQHKPLIVIYNVYCITMYSTSCSGKVRKARQVGSSMRIIVLSLKLPLLMTSLYVLCFLCFFSSAFSNVRAEHTALYRIAQCGATAP